jgi:hypothetical protein
VYDRTRFFAVTGLRLAGPAEPTDVTDALEWLKTKYWPDEPAARTGAAPDFHGEAAVIDRARKYLCKLPPAVSGQGGHNATFHAACVLVLGFELGQSDALALLSEWNSKCSPPWSERDLEHKVHDAAKRPGKRGYLRNVKPANWSKIEVPHYTQAAPAAAPQTPGAKPTRQVKSTKLADAAQNYIEQLRKGDSPLVSTSIPDLDYALGGGLGFGEFALFAARPSHGKSAVALQALHSWPSVQDAAPAVIVSEEMSALMLGKRTLQFTTTVREAEWRTQLDRIDDELMVYRGTHSDAFVLEGCGTAEAAAEAIEKHVEEHGAKYAIVDYVQLLRAAGESRYEQVTNASVILRQLASRTKIVLLALAQLNRAVEQRGGEFLPIMSDLRDSGQLEQDADAIVFQCWPHRLNPNEPKSRYQFFIAKNRNRETRAARVECQFFADRQMFRGRPTE